MVRARVEEVMRCERLTLTSMRRGRGRPKKYWGELIRQDMTQLQLTEDMTLNRKVYFRTRGSLVLSFWLCWCYYSIVAFHLLMPRVYSETAFLPHGRVCQGDEIPLKNDVRLKTYRMNRIPLQPAAVCLRHDI